jgi:hypothetical protein
MLRRLLLSSLVVLLLACSPTLNWREVRLAGGELKALLPCKPDQATRRQSIAGRELELRMLGCEAGGALYALSVVELGDAADALAVQVQWQANLLGTLQANTSASSPWGLKGAGSSLEPVQLNAQGMRPDGRPLAARAVWFAQGTRLYHAVLYANHISTEMSEPFFSGLELP